MGQAREKGNGRFKKRGGGGGRKEGKREFWRSRRNIKSMK